MYESLKNKLNKHLNNFKRLLGINPKNKWANYYTKTPKEIKYDNGSLIDAVLLSASMYPNNIAIEYYNTQISYVEFVNKIKKCARSLKRIGVEEDDRVTICMPNTPEAVIMFYAINMVGAVANMIHPLSSENEINFYLNKAKSKVILTIDLCYPKVMNAIKDTKVKHVVVSSATKSMGFVVDTFYYLFKGRKNDKSMKENKEIVLSWRQFIKNGAYYNEEYYVKRKDTDLAVILYSGGTTGKPKGIIISNGNFNAMALQTKTVCNEIKPGNSVLSALPIFHVFGLALCCHTCLCAGMTCIIVPKINTKKINSEIKKYKPNVYPAVPSLLKMSVDGMKPGKNALKDIKVVVVGGDYLPQDLKIQFEKFLRECGSDAVVKVGYGLSEATGFSCCTANMNESDVINGTLGIPNPDMDIRIFEPNSDVEKETGEIGEICINGPTIMMGYINEDEETAKTLVNHSDGKIWLHTGDLGYRNEDGLLFYSSRLKRMIITNGYNVYPIELEEIISKCECVSSCTVVGIPHKTKGQTPKAVIVLKDGYEDTLETKAKVRAYCKEHLAAYAVPSEIEYRKSVPVTAIGKVAYRELEKKHKKK